MKKILFFIWVVWGCIFSVSAQNALQVTDSLQTNRYVMRATMYGAGRTRILDTYLSPVEYTGIEARITRETMRMTHLWDGNVSVQNFFQANLSYTENPAENSNEFAGLVNWNYGLHYQFRINRNLKLLAGGLGEVNGGFIYNLRNSNNLASAKAYLNVAASGMAIYHFKIGNYPLIARYQVNVPVAGVMFSPDHQESYYEIFTLKNHHNIVKFTSLHNQPSVRQMLTLDFPVRYVKLRIGYIWDVQQSKVNGLKTHMYSHLFMIGFVKNLYRIRDKNSIALPASVSAY